MRLVSGKQCQMKSREKKWRRKTDILKMIWLEASLWYISVQGDRDGAADAWSLDDYPGQVTDLVTVEYDFFFFFFLLQKVSTLPSLSYLSGREQTVSGLDRSESVLSAEAGSSVNTNQPVPSAVIRVRVMTTSHPCLTPDMGQFLLHVFFLPSSRSPLFQKLGHHILKLLFLIQFFSFLFLNVPHILCQACICYTIIMIYSELDKCFSAVTGVTVLVITVKAACTRDFSPTRIETWAFSRPQAVFLAFIIL